VKHRNQGEKASPVTTELPSILFLFYTDRKAIKRQEQKNIKYCERGRFPSIRNVIIGKSLEIRMQDEFTV